MFGWKISVFALTLGGCSLVIFLFADIAHVFDMEYRYVASEGRDKEMEIRVGENESLESALKRFKRKCARSGVLAEVRRREHYEKPSVKRKKKAEAARKRKY